MKIKQKLSVEQWRSMNGISRKKLAEKTGLSYDTIMRYENDVNQLRAATYLNLEKIANALGVSVDDIFLDSNSD